MPPAPELIRIATRKSPLALWQAEYVAARLREVHPGLKTELVKVTTRGDRILDSPLAKVGGKGLFVKELELALEDDRADIAVHSLKDIPVELPPGFHLAAVLTRDDPRDAFVSNRYLSFQALPRHARIGTSSLRRQCQVKRRYPDGDIRPLRGNVNTRLEKLDAGEYDAVILAVAGLRRLGFARRITEALSTDILLPAIGQGAIGIEGRLDDRRMRELVSVLHDPESAVCVTAERAMNRALRGGCQVPVAGYAVLDGEQVLLRGLVGSSDGTEVLYAERRGCARDAEALGRGLAADLLERGAGRLLKQILADQ